MIDVFVSRPNWIPSGIDRHLPEFYDSLADQGFNPKTIGQNIVPMSSPFDEVVSLMNKCSCTIVLGMPKIFTHEGNIKKDPVPKNAMLPTEWNQIEASISIMLSKPTLMMLHKTVIGRGVFERGAANVFVHEFDSSYPGWSSTVLPYLEALREKVNA